MPRSLIQRWRQVFPNHAYDTNYGLSESIGPGCVHLGIENIDHVGAIGVPGYRWECRIVDEQGNVVGQNVVGELCVKGPGLMECYYKDPEATAETLIDGWLHTGDMARQDDEGFYWLVDRKKDVIITGGENLYPVQIEDFMVCDPGCADVIVAFEAVEALRAQQLLAEGGRLFVNDEQIVPVSVNIGNFAMRMTSHCS